MLPASAHHLDLRRLELFHPLEVAELDAFLSHARDRWLEPGDVLFREGDPGDALAIVVRGEVAVSLRDVPIPGAEVAVLGAGALIGEGAFIDPEPRSSTVVATAPSVVLELDRRGFEALRREWPRVAARLLTAILHGVARKLHAVDRRIAIELGEVSAFAPLSSPPAAEPGRIRSRWPRSAPPPPRRPTVEPFALRACGVTLDCGDDDLRALLSACEERHFAGGEVLSSQGSEARCCYFVLAGEVEVVKALMAGERVLTTLRAGSTVGQAALLDGTRRSATLRARRTVTALEMGRDGYERLVGAGGPAAVSLQHHLATVSVRQLREADRRLVAVLARGRGRAGASPMTGGGAEPREDRRRRDLQYIQAAVGEVSMDLDVIEMGDGDLLPATGDDGSSHAPPPLPGGHVGA